MWDVWLSIEEELKERTPFDVYFELLNSPEAHKLLAPVPQLNIAAATSGTGSYQTTIDQAINAPQEHINPVDFEHITALVESERLAHQNIAKGKILSCRMPDLMIRYNRIFTSMTWEQLAQEGARKARKSDE